MSSANVRVKALPAVAFQIEEQAAYYRLEAYASVAERWRAAVNEAIRSLHVFPERGARLQLKMSVQYDLRKLGVAGFPNHLIFYRWDAAARIVLIVAVAHGARDFETFRL